MLPARKIPCPNTLSLVLFAGMTLNKCAVLPTGMLTRCSMCREVNPLCRLKTVIWIWLLVGFHLATRSVQSTPADNACKSARQCKRKKYAPYLGQQLTGPAGDGEI